MLSPWFCIHICQFMFILLKGNMKFLDWDFNGIIFCSSECEDLWVTYLENRMLYLT